MLPGTELDCSCTWLLVNVAELDLQLHTNQLRDTEVPLFGLSKLGPDFYFGVVIQ